MKTWRSTLKVCAILIAIGLAFRTYGAYAIDTDCTAEQPHVTGGPVCLDIPQGPRFTVRR